MTAKKKIIEAGIPLEEINAASAREKSIRHGHPSTLHLWWSRKPLATTRAVIFASLVDDPSAHPELFPTEAEQANERTRLHEIIKKLVVWENSTDKELFSEARREIEKSCGGKLPALLDPFAGGGSIPLEAQRLGLRALAADINPVAVMINKAMIEIPPRFANRAPVNPEAESRTALWEGAAGLAEDVRYYGNKLREEAFRRVGHLYPKVKDSLGVERTVIAWKWARTVKCPNPACGCEAPLASGFVLSKGRGREIHVHLSFDGQKARYEIKEGAAELAGTVNRRGAVCARCGTAIPFTYIRAEGRAGRMGSQMMAVVAEGDNGRIYLPPNDAHIAAASCGVPVDVPESNLPESALGFRVQVYGMTHHKDLFTNRQLTMLTTFSDLISEAAEWAHADALVRGYEEGAPLRDGGGGARAYGEAVAVYLAFVIDKLTDYHSSICSWHSSGEKMRNTFARQAIPMVWDYAECNPFCSSSGSFDNMLDWVTKATDALPAASSGRACQHDAAEREEIEHVAVSTDPPYYDNIGYADLSDYLYVWMRRSLRGIYPDLFKSVLTPKAPELVATPYRFEGGADEAKKFFESGMSRALAQIYKAASDDLPVTIYYAFKQSESDDDGRASTGWETMLSAIMKAGFSITGTWPIRTELLTRSTGQGTNALASSIVLVCRKRTESRDMTRREFTNALSTEMRRAVRELQSSNIAPVDMAQAAIGPGMAVYSRCARVLSPSGEELSVRGALKMINDELDKIFSEQMGRLDSESSFCAALYEQRGYEKLSFGEADVLARAKNISVEELAREGYLRAERGSVSLIPREQMAALDDNETSAWKTAQGLTRAMESDGIEGAARLLSRLDKSCESAFDLVYGLHAVAERKGWQKETLAYNTLVQSWPEIRRRAEKLRESGERGQGKLF